MINEQKKEVTIFQDTYKLDNIEFIYTQDNNLVVCLKGKTKKYVCLDAPKTFRDVATMFILSKFDNFVLLLTGNNIVNVNAIKNLKVEMDDLTIETNSHKRTIYNTGGFEYACLKSKLPQKIISEKDITK